MSKTLNQLPFVFDAWYVAALSSEIGPQLLGRSYLGVPIVLYRTTAGEPIALLDACAHRQFPLSRSTLVGDEIRCGYHGFTFDEDGTCVHIPSCEKIPQSARVRKYPLVERHGMVWIWLGETESVDHTMLPELRWLDTDNKVSYYVHLKANYQLLIENLLDFSHVPFVHHDQQGHPELARVVPEAEMNESMVISTRTMHNSPTPPLWADVMQLPLGGPMDHEQRFEFRAPSSVCIRQSVWAPNAPSRKYPFTTSHFMTPDGEGATHYWSWVSLEWEGVSADTLARMDRGASEVAEQDVFALEAQQALHAQLQRQAIRPVIVSVPFDRGSLLSRQAISRLVGQEQARQAPDK
jgi:vanillate O-demethylase monooxygenase subunit